MQHRRNKKKYI